MEPVKRRTKSKPRAGGAAEQRRAARYAMPGGTCCAAALMDRNCSRVAGGLHVAPSGPRNVFIHRPIVLALNIIITIIIAAAGAGAGAAAAQDTGEALNRYIEQSLTATRHNPESPGSLYTSRSFLAEMVRDPKAAAVGDLVTILVVEQASALTSGATSSSRSSEGSSSIAALLGTLSPAGRLANLARSSGKSTLQGQGSTSRQTSITATLTAQVTHVMPNGNLVIEGLKEIVVNSERHVVWLRGVARQVDLSPDNSLRSDRIGLMALKINGKGVVSDAIRRPNALFRFFKKLLPF